MVYDDYREDKEFSKQISSSLHSLLLVQRVDCNISGMTVNSSLHSRRQSMIGLRHIQQYNISHVRTQHQTRARKNESGSWPGQCWWWNCGTWGGNRPPSWACWRLVCTRFSERVLLASPPETPPSLTCTSGLEEKKVMKLIVIKRMWYPSWVLGLGCVWSTRVFEFHQHLSSSTRKWSE